MKGKRKGKGQVRLYVYTCIQPPRHAVAPPGIREESRGYIQLLKLEAPSPSVKHSGKRSPLQLDSSSSPCSSLLSWSPSSFPSCSASSALFPPHGPSFPVPSSFLWFSSRSFLLNILSVLYCKLIYLYTLLFPSLSLSSPSSLSFSLPIDHRFSSVTLSVLSCKFRRNFATSEAPRLARRSFLVRSPVTSVAESTRTRKDLCTLPLFLPLSPSPCLSPLSSHSPSTLVISVIPE